MLGVNGFIGRLRRFKGIQAQQCQAQAEYQLLARALFAQGVIGGAHRMLASKGSTAKP
ncbi:hypothetical protein D3C77_771840 [compost metagenome]